MSTLRSGDELVLATSATSGSLRRRLAGQAVSLCAAAGGLAWIALTVLGKNSIPPIWPANGVILAVILRAAPRHRLVLLTAGVFGMFVAGVITDSKPWGAAEFALFDFGEIGLAFVIIRAFIKDAVDLSRQRDVIICAAAALLSALACALAAGAEIGWYGRPALIENLSLWTLSDSLGQAVGAPIMLTLLSGGLRGAFFRRSPYGSIGALALLVVVCVAVFLQPVYRLKFLIFAPMLLVVFRLEVLGAALCVLITTIIAVGLLIIGYDPMLPISAGGEGGEILLQVFLLGSAVLNFPVAAALADRRRTQEGLRASQARMGFLTAHARDVVIRLSTDHTMLDVSPSCIRFGYRPEDLIGKSGYEFNHPDDRDRVWAMIDDLAPAWRGDTRSCGEWRVRSKAGEWMWAQGDVTAIRDAEGRAIEYALVMRDIGEQKAASKALAESESRYRVLAENSRDLVVQFDDSGLILYAATAAQWLGYGSGDLVGRLSADLIHPDDHAMSQARLALAAAGDYPENPLEFRIKNASGDYIWVEGNPTISGRDGQGRLIFSDSLRDITLRRAAQMALVSNEANYRLLTDNAPDVILRVRIGGVITYLSPAVEAVTGYGVDELLGTNIYDLVHPDDVDQTWAWYRRFLDSGRINAVEPCEYRLVRKDGVVVLIEATPYLLTDPETGETLGLGGFLRDITQRRALEDDVRLKRAQAEAAEAARRAAEEAARETQAELARVARVLSVGEFATSVAHELNQPIAAIVTNSDTSLRWLAKDPPNLDEARATIARTIRDANRAAQVISRTRAMLSKAPPAIAELNLNTCLDEVLLFTETELRRNHVTVIRQLSATLPRVKGDRIQLQQVMLNLVRNGIEAMADNRDQPKVLTVDTRAAITGGAQVSITDTGVGLDASAAAHLFESFFTTKVGGIGLGLPISRTIIENHGGRLWAEPGPERGAMFLFSLPAATGFAS